MQNQIRGGMHKKAFSFIFIFIFVCSSAFAARYDVAVIKSGERAQYSSAISGFSLQLKNLGIKSKISQHILLSDGSNTYQITQALQMNRPDAVLAVGTEAAVFAVDKIEDIPVVFCMVLDPLDHNLDNYDNVAGVSLNIPYDTHLQAIKEVFPDLTSIGLIYDPKYNENNVDAIALAAMNAGIAIYMEPVDVAPQIPKVFPRLVKKIDALWIIPDATVCSTYSIKYLLLNTMKESVPLIGISAEYVKAGAIVALEADYDDNGRQAAGLLSKQLNGELIESKIVHPRKYGLILNMKNADALGINIPLAVQRKAKKF